MKIRWMLFLKLWEWIDFGAQKVGRPKLAIRPYQLFNDLKHFINGNFLLLHSYNEFGSFFLADPPIDH